MLYSILLAMQDCGKEHSGGKIQGGSETNPHGDLQSQEILEPLILVGKQKRTPRLVTK